MKLTASCLTLAFLVSLNFAAFAGDKAPSVAQHKPQKVPKTAEKKDQRTDPVTVTGSHLKRTINHQGYVSDGPNLVYVLDDNTIRNSGASTVRELLTRRGVAR